MLLSTEIILRILYFVVNSIIAYPKYLIVKKKSILTTGTIIDLKDIKYKYNKKAKIVARTYIYNLEIDIEGQKRITEYSEHFWGDGINSILNGTSLEVFYNSSDNTAVNAVRLKKDIWEYPLYTVVIGVVIAIGLIISYNVFYKKA
ncbi:MAG: hypothetical protein J1F01_02830 [Oscillospiraceae bacterium]|nr:hypothetical protein [Oscillospiraceae bacterium]